MGPGGPVGPARTGPARRGRNLRPPLPQLRPHADRDGTGSPRHSASGAGAHPVRAAGARGDPGPRHGRRARRQPGIALHRRIHRRVVPRRARRRAAACPRAGEPRDGPHRSRRRLRRRGGRRHGLDPRRLPRRRPHRRDQGAVHQRRHRSFRRLRRQFHQADAGGRIRRHGGGPDRASARPARRHPGRAALRRRDGRAAAPGVGPPQGRRRCTAHRPRRPRRLRQGLALHAGARYRRADRRHLRHQPAFHHGAGRHAFVRARRLFRARHLWRGAAGEVPASTHAARARGGAGRGDARRAAVRLVRGAARPASISPCSRSPSPRSCGRSCSSGRK